MQGMGKKQRKRGWLNCCLLEVTCRSLGEEKDLMLFKGLLFSWGFQAGFLVHSHSSALESEIANLRAVAMNHTVIFV